MNSSKYRICYPTFNANQVEGKFKTYGNSLSLLGGQNKDLGTALQMLLVGVRTHLQHKLLKTDTLEKQRISF